ncbi:NRAMP family divalent metal transporter [Pseudomonas oryzihabitans]|uniref:Mn2+/Fe2+ NRAMP family transporter n=1 Tax=Pseudomonas oryzihabitans TaxID=47885 RepID=A0AAJ2BQZ7_9PSED|nr:divalent metal cation transporter [Pseudomonas psychrotolerans]MDR6234802.1 Mn2+/Fe2+ NRAMP family transporter [Pseudomonas psychrotolerans]MDR6356028.1 Mn2+/Fe2+ NRAMP family transporter [Pseudomonas psychrotolerans]
MTQTASATQAFAKDRRASLIAAIFLMATSAIGPGFLTQTATFTAKLGAAFAFGILASILIDFVVQLNVWRIVALTRMRASDIANAAIPGSGYLLAVLVISGGLVFSLGNIAGAGLGLNALFGLDPAWGGALSALMAIGIFLSHRAGIAMDRIMVVLGVFKVALILIACFASHPPVGEALRQTFLPDVLDFASITTIVGGTVGGYITYAGAHRLLDRGTVGVENIDAVSKAALSGILVTGIARYVLFLAIFGVVASGVVIDVSGQAANPAAQAFDASLGEYGLRVFGLVLWAAGISSIIGAAYTSMTFITVFSKNITERARNLCTVVFVLIALGIYLSIGKPPAALLVFAGGFNGLILPLGLTLFMYVGWRRSDLMEGYHYPRWLLVLGGLTCLLSWYMAVKSAGPIFHLLSAA